MQLLWSHIAQKLAYKNAIGAGVIKGGLDMCIAIHEIPILMKVKVDIDPKKKLS